MTTHTTPVDQRFRALRWIVAAVLIVGLLVGLVLDLSQLEGKGWEARAVFYTLVVGLLRFLWWASGKRFAYSYLADAFLVMPFALDILGNLAGLYDSLASFDDILHFVNWVFLVGAFVLSMQRSTNLSRLNRVTLGIGFGATMIILWEAVEFIVMKLGTERLFLTYEDTISDLLLSSSGGVLGALLVVFLLNKR